MKNYVNLIGRLGSDPELKSTENSSYAKTSLATSEKYKDKAGEKKEVELKLHSYSQHVWSSIVSI